MREQGLYYPIIEDKELNILITGGAGFIGSHLGEAMLKSGHNVIAVDDLSTGSVNNIKALMENDRYEFVRDSVQNVQTMNSLVGRCDVIFHLAAAVGVQLIVEQPVHTIETNIHGSEVMLELANKFRCKILIASTSEVYGKNTKIPFSEDDDVTFGSTKFTRWSYACSKMIDEFLAQIESNPFHHSPIPNVHPHKLKEQILEIKGNPTKATKAVSLDSVLGKISFLKLRTGFWIASQKGEIFYPIPDHATLESDHAEFVRSLDG